MTHFDHDAIRLAARQYATDIHDINENTRIQRERTQKIVRRGRAVATVLSYVGTFAEGFVAGNKR